jgi:hypothetical protein
VRHDRVRGDPEHLRGAGGIQVQQKSQRDDLALPGRQPRQCRPVLRIDQMIGASELGRSPARAAAPAGSSGNDPSAPMHVILLLHESTLRSGM